VRAVRETPWAILEETYWSIVELVDVRVAGGQFSTEEIQARIGAGPARQDYQTAGTVAIIPVYGVLTPRADLMSEISGGTSVQRLTETFRAAVADDGVSAIVLDIESPGGSSDLIPELATEMRQARGTKPIVAVANTRAASAAYWLGSQADEFVVSPSGDVGSIGVFATHNDISKMQQDLGVKTTLISAGQFKTEGNPFEPLTEEAVQAIQERVDEMYGMFVSDVAKGRNVGVDTVRSDFGQGRMLSAQKRSTPAWSTASTRSTRRSAASRANAPRSPHRRPRPADTDDLQTSFTDDLEAAHRAIDLVVTRGETLRVLTATKRDQLAHLAERLGALVESTTAEPKREPEDESLDLEATYLEMATRARLEPATT
jgi:signal peptide peptidase SppA